MKRLAGLHASQAALVLSAAQQLDKASGSRRDNHMSEAVLAVCSVEEHPLPHQPHLPFPHVCVEENFKQIGFRWCDLPSFHRES